MTIWRRFAWLLRPLPWRVVGLEKEADEVPALIESQGIYLVASEGRLKWAIFDCPCGRGHRIMLNLDGARKPTWALSIRNNRVSVTPSIDIHTDFGRCHFFIRNGQIQWARGEW